MKNESPLFTEIARRWTTKPGVTRGSMMGFPCLRVSGGFFACVDRVGEHLIVKLPEARVKELVAQEQGLTFAPNGRTFREWMAISTHMEDTWEARLSEAYAFVGGAA